KDNHVIIPIYVVEEIDKFKRDLSELGRNARQVSRDLDAFREENGSLTEGVPLEGGGTLRVMFTQKQLPRELMNQHEADNRILALAMDVKEREPNLRCVFVTKDINLRIRADALGLVTEDYENDKIENPEVYMGVRELEVAKGDIDDFYARGELAPPDGINGVYPNEFALLKDRNAPNHTALSKYSGLLPGTVEEKLNPWMQPIYDNVEFLMGLSRADKKAGRSYRELIDLGLVAIEPLTYIRGRSIPNQYIVVDEAQNLTPHE